MEVNKKNGPICFSEAEHIYWNENDNERYISVTTLIERYGLDFDSEFWSFYKTLEKLIPEDNWKIEKKSLLNRRIVDKNLLSIYNINENEFNEVQQGILDEWEQTNKEACERGTKIHSLLENTFYQAGKNVSLKKFEIGGKFECRKDYTELDLEHGVYPEYLFYYESDDKILRVAGQSDLVIKNGNEIIIADYKTNKKIDTKSYYNQNTKSSDKMKYPLNHLDECNYSHYNLQLSLYAWMLQQIHPEFIIKDLMIIHFDHNNKCTIYHCNYLKNEVEMLLKDYKKQIIRDKQKAKRKPIEY